MNIRIKLYAGLAKFLPEGSTNKQAPLSVPEAVTIGEVLSTLGIHHTMARLIVVNGVNRKPDYVLQEGDSLNIYPHFAGG
jgi:hypothetical protein